LSFDDMQTFASNATPSDGDLWEYVACVRADIEEALEACLPLAPDAVGTRFNEALRWSLFPGGKRLRPVLTLLGAEIVGGRGSSVLSAAAAIEYIHTSSLIFDDLPCMDNALERRGRASVHSRYGEGLAVLVALALMNTSYGLIFLTDGASVRAAITAHKEFVECIGTNGMVVGQTVDLAKDGESNAPLQVRNLKTSALMRMALRTGAILAGGSDKDLDALSKFAESIGDAYQMRDDVLDAQEDQALAANSQRTQTIAMSDGAGGAMRRVHELVANSKGSLRTHFGSTVAAARLSQMADYIATRAA
jgi:geranylgeranyl diphosphate synthase type II